MRQISDSFYNKLYKIYKSSLLYSPIKKSFKNYKIEGKQTDNNSKKKYRTRSLPKIKNTSKKGIK